MLHHSFLKAPLLVEEMYIYISNVDYDNDYVIWNRGNSAVDGGKPDLEHLDKTLMKVCIGGCQWQTYN